MAYMCCDCNKSISIYKEKTFSFCPFCGSENIVEQRKHNAKAYAEMAIPRMHELSGIINDYCEKLAEARKEYHTLYMTIKKYQERGIVPADADIPLIVDGRKLR